MSINGELGTEDNLLEEAEKHRLLQCLDQDHEFRDLYFSPANRFRQPHAFLRDYQQDGILRVVRYWNEELDVQRSPRRDPAILLPTGSGKSHVRLPIAQTCGTIIKNSITSRKKRTTHTIAGWVGTSLHGLCSARSKEQGAKSSSTRAHSLPKQGDPQQPSEGL
jgi:hypothetical protein